MIYRHDRANLQTILGPGDEILEFHQGEVTWPPDYAIVRSLPRRYFVMIAGTIGPAQLALQSSALNAVAYQGTGGGYTSALWLAAADAIDATLKARVDVDIPETRLYFSGHSYGGVVAQLLAFRYARRLGSDKVQLLTFAQPKGLSPSYSREQPSPYWRVHSNLDIVPTLFLDSPGLVLVQPGKPASWQDIGAQWVHYGADSVIDVHGVIGGAADDAKPLPPDVEVGRIAEHYPSNYLGRVRQYVIRQGGNRAALDAIEAAFDTRRQQPHENYRGGWSLFDLGLPAEVLPDLINRLGLGSQYVNQGGGAMGLQKHSFIFTGPDSETWSESYLIDGSSDLNAAVWGIPDDLIKLRAVMLHKAFTIRAVRASSTVKPKRSAIRIVSVVGEAANTEVNPGPDISGATSVCRLVCVNGARRNVWFRGWADSDINRLVGGKDQKAGTLGTHTKAFIAALAKLHYGVARRLKEGEGDNLDARHATAVDGSIISGQSLIKVESTVGFVPKDLVSLSLFSKKDCPGLNGTYEVVSVTEGVGIYVRYRTPGDLNLLKQPGLVRRVAYAPLSDFFPDHCMTTHYGTRKTKRGFTGSRGAGRAARIRHSV